LEVDDVLIELFMFFGVGGCCFEGGLGDVHGAGGDIELF